MKFSVAVLLGLGVGLSAHAQPEFRPQHMTTTDDQTASPAESSSKVYAPPPGPYREELLSEKAESRGEYPATAMPGDQYWGPGSQAGAMPSMPGADQQPPLAPGDGAIPYPGDLYAGGSALPQGRGPAPGYEPPMPQGGYPQSGYAPGGYAGGGAPAYGYAPNGFMPDSMPWNGFSQGFGMPGGGWGVPGGSFWGSPGYGQEYGHSYGRGYGPGPYGQGPYGQAAPVIRGQEFWGPEPRGYGGSGYGPAYGGGGYGNPYSGGPMQPYGPARGGYPY